MKKIFALTSALVALLTSCVHQFPVTMPADVTLTLSIDKD